MLMKMYETCIKQHSWMKMAINFIHMSHTMICVINFKWFNLTQSFIYRAHCILVVYSVTSLVWSCLVCAINAVYDINVDGKFPISSISIYNQFHPPPYITNFANVKKFSQLFHPCSQLYLCCDFSCWLISFKWLDHFMLWISSMWELLISINFI
jgi:hypothetical protein